MTRKQLYLSIVSNCDFFSLDNVLHLAETDRDISPTEADGIRAAAYARALECLYAGATVGKG